MLLSLRKVYLPFLFVKLNDNCELVSIPGMVIIIKGCT